MQFAIWQIWFQGGMFAFIKYVYTKDWGILKKLAHANLNLRAEIRTDACCTRLVLGFNTRSVLWILAPSLRGLRTDEDVIFTN